MAHFAKLDENNIVIDVVVVNNNVILDNNDEESEVLGKTFLNDLLGEGTWIKTSYNGNIRQRFAGIGMIYDETNDVFIYPQPYPSWILNENFEWQSPVDYPTDERRYTWNENEQQWDLDG